MSLLRGLPSAQTLIIATLSACSAETDTGVELVRTPAYEAYLNAH